MWHDKRCLYMYVVRLITVWPVWLARPLHSRLLVFVGLKDYRPVITQITTPACGGLKFSLYSLTHELPFPYVGNYIIKFKFIPFIHSLFCDSSETQYFCL